MLDRYSPRRAKLNAPGMRCLLYVLTVLWLGLSFCSVPDRALADVPPGYHLYLSTSNGPVEVTSTYYNSNGQDYVVYGQPIAVTLSYEEGHIYDLLGYQIGYINYVPPSPPG